MKRVISIVEAGPATLRDAVDRVWIEGDERTRRRIALIGESGSRYLLDMKEPVTLQHDQGLEMDDGSVVLVGVRSEPLLEIEPRTPLELVRLAWHLGNRHTDVQIVDARIRIRYDHVLEEMVRGLGAKVATIDARFDPEPVAPGGHGGHGHGGHDHAHHGHGHHDHAHDHHSHGE